MIIIGVVYGAFSGHLPDITNAAIDSSKEAVTITLTMVGILAMWTGLMKIAENAGLISALSFKMRPLLKFLFPKLSNKSKAIQYISTNIIANMLGLSWAATPAGLKAIDELQKLNPNKSVASKEMCMFMIINMSSLQLVSVNIVAYRSQFNSTNPSEIIGPGLLATLVSTLIAIVLAKIFEKSE